MTSAKSDPAVAPLPFTTSFRMTSLPPPWPPLTVLAAGQPWGRKPSTQPASPPTSTVSGGQERRQNLPARIPQDAKNGDLVAALRDGIEQRVHHTQGASRPLLPTLFRPPQEHLLG
jgi:hypothetical protein